ncbi:GTP-binding protein gtr1 [Tulasnella sp. 403]|nr:GTP-binding protein gtr1 [Tulasnella sp. 403]
MARLNVYIIRHGETAQNRAGIIQGQLETQLNKTGQEQARRLAFALKDEHFDYAFTSNLERAIETMKRVLEFHPDVKLEIQPELRERNMGELQGKKRTSPENPPSVEPMDKLVARILGWWDSTIVPLLDRRGDGNDTVNVLVIGHGAYLANLVRTLAAQRGFDTRLWSGSRKKALNTGISILEVEADGSGRLAVFSDVRHLEGMVDDVVATNADDQDASVNAGVLLMGRSGSGKTSMRSIIFSNNVTASGTARFGATIDVEQNTVRFLGSLVLNLWDCGGQESFLESYLTVQKSTIFQHVGVLIYVFDVESRDTEKDLGYYRDCLEACGKHSPGASVFLLVHKMDLVGGKKERHDVFNRKKKDLLANSGDAKVKIFGTTIWDESLYKVPQPKSGTTFTNSRRPPQKAWSRIVHALIPNAPLLSTHLSTFSRICSASEVVLFERTTFLIIARSGDQSMAEFDSDSDAESYDGTRAVTGQTIDEMLNPKRFEKISELIKAFKISCSKLQEQFSSLEIRFPNYTALLEILTTNTYVMVIVADPNVQSAALRLNVRLAREKFDELQAGSVYAPA